MQIMNTNRQGDWIQTYTGRKFYTLDPRPEEVDIVDIAHALSMMCRYNGHCERFYSVAEHSVLIARHLPLKYKLWGLLHDASEAYIADINRPTKRFMPEYKSIERNIMLAVCDHFGLDRDEPFEVKCADNGILFDECAQNMKTPPNDWALTDPPLGVTLKYWPPACAKHWFLTTYEDIITKMKEAA